MSKNRKKYSPKKARDKRLRSSHGISLGEYEHILRLQGGGCWICGRKKKSVSLHVDHDHRARKSKRHTWKRGPHRWRSATEYNGRRYVGKGKTKGKAVKSLLKKLKRASVRGILCFPCNRGIRVFWDCPKSLSRAAKYLARFSMGVTDVPENSNGTE